MSKSKVDIDETLSSYFIKSSEIFTENEKMLKNYL